MNEKFQKIWRLGNSQFLTCFRNVKVREGVIDGTTIVNNSLYIDRIDGERAGIYTCEVDTIAGFESSSGNFSVYCKFVYCCKLSVYLFS